MADYKWIAISGSPSQYATGANWKDVDAGTTGTAPGATDNSFFDGEGTDDVAFDTAVVSQTTGKVVFSSLYTGKVGTAGVPCDVDADTVKYAGSGTEAYFDLVGTITFTCKTSSRGTNACKISNCTITTINHLRGNMTLDTVVATDIFTSFLASPQNDTILNVNSGCNLGSVYANSGRVNINDSTVDPAIDLLILHGGIVTLTAGNITTLRLHGGQFIHNYQDDGTDNPVTCYLVGGQLNMSMSAKKRTITTLHHWPTGQFNAANGSDSITVSNYFAYGNVNLIAGSNNFTPQQV